MNRKNSITCTCEFCSVKFDVKPHTLHDNINVQRRGVFCSNKCKGYALAAKRYNLSFKEAYAKWILKLRPTAFHCKDEIFG